MVTDFEIDVAGDWASKVSGEVFRAVECDATHVWYECEGFRGPQPCLRSVWFASMHPAQPPKLKGAQVSSGD